MSMREKENQTTQHIEQEINELLSSRTKPQLEIKTTNSNFPMSSDKLFQNFPYVSPTVNRDIPERLAFVKSGSQIISSTRNLSQNERNLVPSAQNSNHLPPNFHNSEITSNAKPIFGLRDKLASPPSQVFSAGIGGNDRPTNFQSIIGQEIMKGDPLMRNKPTLDLDLQPSSYSNLHRIYSSPAKPIALMQNFNAYDRARADYSSQHGSRLQPQGNLSSNPDYYKPKVQWFQGPEAMNYQERFSKFSQNNPMKDNTQLDTLLAQATPTHTSNIPFNSLAERSINNRSRDLNLNANAKDNGMLGLMKQHSAPKADSGILIIEQGQTARFGELASTRSAGLKPDSPSAKGKALANIGLNTFSKPEPPRLSNADSKDRFPKEIFNAAPRRKFIA